MTTHRRQARRAAALGVVVTLALAGCGDEASDPVSATDLPAQAVQLPAASFDAALGGFASFSGLSARERLVVRDAAAWEALWPRVVRDVRPMPPVPAVDFTRDEVIVAAMGTRPSGGHAIAIAGVYEADGRRWVVVQSTSPGTGCVTATALTAPLAAVRVARSALPTVFVERTGTTPGCA
jgi:hypothetical protein